jgi:glycerate 2-kinase
VSRWLVAPQEYKGTLTAAEAAAALAEGLRRGAPWAELDVAPLADGGPGTVEALLAAAVGERVQLTVQGPLGAPVQAVYGRLAGGYTAVMEMAAASGLSLLPPAARDVRRASTYGTGELIRAALEAGCQRLLIGLGGSATNDGGTGALAALGFRFLDEHGQTLPPGGAALRHLARVDASGRHPRLDQVELLAGTDVVAPLLGPQGASRLFGPQKGADAEAVEELEAALERLAEVVEPALARVAGTGAAGGLGYGLLALAGARLMSGYAWVAQALGLEARVARADVVLTGEGRYDRQTALGKGPGELARQARALGRRVVMFAGSLSPEVPGEEALFDEVLEVSALAPPGASPAEALRSAAERWASRMRPLPLGEGGR